MLSVDGGWLQLSLQQLPAPPTEMVQWEDIATVIMFH